MSVTISLLFAIRWVEAITPNHYYGNTFYQYGISHQKKGNFPKAAYCFRKAIKYNPGLAEAYFSAGHLLYLFSDYEQAAELLRKCAQLNSSIDRAFYFLGTIYYNKGYFNRAILELREGVKNRRFTYPTTYYFLLGLCYLEADNKESARTCAVKIKKSGGAGKLADLLYLKIDQKEGADE